MTRNAEHSPARNVIIAANIVGFGCVTAMDVWGVFSGDARLVPMGLRQLRLIVAGAVMAAGATAQRRIPV